MIYQKQLQQPISKGIILGFMLLLLLFGAVPGYLSGKWLWADMPPIKSQPQLHNIHKDGLTLPEWKTVDKKNLRISGHDWLIQTVQQDQQKALVFLLPQNYYKDQPQVEWIDLNGFNGWKTDSYQTLQIAVKSTTDSSAPLEAKARFFRGWTSSETYAVVQWYAWPGGGHFAPSHWFWIDRMAQLSQNRAPWVAVSLLIPIEPLGNIETVKPIAESLAASVQSSLMAEALSQK